MPGAVVVDHDLEAILPVVEQHFVAQHPTALAHIGQGGKVLLFPGCHLLHHHGIHSDSGHGKEDPVVGLSQAHRGGDALGDPVHPVVHIGLLHQFLGYQVHGTSRIDADVGPVILVHTFFHQGPQGTVAPGHDHPLDLLLADFLPGGLGLPKGPHCDVLEPFWSVHPHQLPGNAFHIAVDPAEEILFPRIPIVDQQYFLECFNIDFMTQHLDPLLFLHST